MTAFLRRNLFEFVYKSDAFFLINLTSGDSKQKSLSPLAGAFDMLAAIEINIIMLNINIYIHNFQLKIPSILVKYN